MGGQNYGENQGQIWKYETSRDKQRWPCSGNDNPYLGLFRKADLSGPASKQTEDTA